MRFEAAVASIPTQHALKRLASAHVVDYSRLDSDELRASILRTMNQCTHPDAVEAALEQALHTEPDLNKRVLAEIVVVDILLKEYGHLVPAAELEEGR